MKKFIKLALVGLVGLSVFASSFACSRKDASVLFVQEAQSAVLTATTLTLNQVSVHTLWFTDRPARKFGYTSTDKFAEKYWNEGKESFQKIPPNGALIDHTMQSDKLHKIDAEVLELSHPQYDSTAHTMSYQVKYINNGKASAAAQNFTDVSLFIDGQCCNMFSHNCCRN